MDEETRQIKQEAKKGWPVIMAWVGGISALIGLFVSLAAGLAMRQAAAVNGEWSNRGFFTAFRMTRLMTRFGMSS